MMSGDLKLRAANEENEFKIEKVFYKPFDSIAQIRDELLFLQIQSFN